MTDTQEPQLPYTAIRHPKCGQWWTGGTRAHCPACCRTFSTDSAADKHRRGAHGKDRHCVDPATVGLVAVDKPYGTLWQNPGSEDGPWFTGLKQDGEAA
ncbi:hypothetical protein ABZ508_26590 [Streptomyces lavendulocolor]|uniref:C2H2-type domain-containing protein n=1 Tax=Streptomyces lavendulocolor TaxID=67316 RepID=A0ABV2WC35_9ACTN